MKKITLLVASIFLVGSMANASENPVFSETKFNNQFGFDEPIAFFERGIEFFVFPNGDFDFNSRPQDSNGNYHYKTAGRRSVEARIPFNYGVRIEHDSFGRVRRVGNTFINYDFNNRVSRIGSVFMRYNRFAIAQIGGMQIIYNRRGQIIDFIGSVNGRNNGFNNGNFQNYQYQNHNNSNDFDEFENEDQDDNYYYKKNKNKESVIERDSSQDKKSEFNKERR